MLAPCCGGSTLYTQQCGWLADSISTPEVGGKALGKMCALADLIQRG